MAHQHKNGFVTLENTLKDNGINYSVQGNYPIRLNRVVIEGVEFKTNAWTNAQMVELSNIIKNAINDGLSVADVLSEGDDNNTDANIYMELLRQYVNTLDMKRDAHACLLHRGKIKKQVNMADVVKADVNDLEKYTKELIKYYNLLLGTYCQRIEDLNRYETILTKLKAYQELCFNSKEYVKDSYQFSKSNLLSLLANAMNNCKLAHDKYKDIFDARIGYTFESTQSAFIYKGYYITPCILENVIKQAWDEIADDNQKIYLTKYYGGKSQKIQTIASDALFDMFNNDSTERLQMLDDLRFNNEVIGV